MPAQREPLVSIIIPVFNSSSFLRSTLDSLLKQTYHNVEIIMIDDGSTDESGRICDEFAKKNAKATAIHINNSGVSFARNVGLANCSGEYVGFVDSDDIVLPNMYSLLVAEAQKSDYDIVQCAFNCVFEGKKNETHYNHSETLDIKPIEKYLFYPNKKISNSIWNKIFHRRIFSKIRFDVDLSIGEDLKYVLEALSLCKSVRLIDDVGYLYHIRFNSAMTSTFSEKRMDDFKINDWCLNKYSNNLEMSKLIKTRDAEYCVSIYYLSTGANSPNPYKKTIINRLRNDKFRYRLATRYELCIFLILHFSTLLDCAIKWMYKKKRKSIENNTNKS